MESDGVPYDVLEDDDLKQGLEQLTTSGVDSTIESSEVSVPSETSLLVLKFPEHLIGDYSSKETTLQGIKLNIEMSAKREHMSIFLHIINLQRLLHDREQFSKEITVKLLHPRGGSWERTFRMIFSNEKVFHRRLLETMARGKYFEDLPRSQLSFTVTVSDLVQAPTTVGELK